MRRGPVIVGVSLLAVGALVAALFFGIDDARADERPRDGGKHAAKQSDAPSLAAAASDGPRDATETTESTATKPAIVDGQSEIDALNSLYSIRGSVLDPSRKPIAGAEVTLLRPFGVNGAVSVKASTNEQGRFVVGHSDRQTWGWRIEARAPGYAPSFLSEVPTSSGVNDVGPILLFRAVSVRGRVTDPEARPVAGAFVFAFAVPEPAESEDEGDYKPLATTGADGAYTIASLPPGTVTLGATAPGFADAVRPGTRLKSDGPNVVDLALGVEDPLEGVVVDENGSSVAKARVSAQRNGPRRSFWRKPIDTDAQGRFRVAGLERSRRDLYVSIQKVGFSGFWGDGNHLPPDARYTIHRAPSMLVRLQAPNGSTGPAIQAIRFERRNTRQPGRWFNGGEVARQMREVVEPSAWRFAWEARGSMRVVVTAEDGSVGHSSELDLRAAPGSATETEVIARIETSGTLSGRVVRGDQTTVAGLRVELLADGNATGGVSKIVRTGDDGRFAFADVQAGSYRLGAKSSEWITDSTTVSIESGEKRDGFELVARRPSTISGKLTIGGKPPGEEIPVQAYKIDLHDQGTSWNMVGVATTNAAGEFTIAPVPAGRIGVVPKRKLDPEDGAVRAFWEEAPQPDFNPQSSNPWRWVVDVPPEASATIDIDMPEPKKSGLHGAVVINGQGRSGLQMWLNAENGSYWRSETTDGEGKFRFKIDRSGDFWLEMYGDGFNESRKIQISEGDDREQNFDLTTGGIEGSVADASGQALVMRLQLRRQQDRQVNSENQYSWFNSSELMSKADGSFTFPEVAAGTYQVIASDSKRRFATVSSTKFTVGFKEKYQVPMITVPLAAPLQVRAKTPDGKPVSGSLTVAAVPGAPPLAQGFHGRLGKTGATRVHGLAPGAVVVTFRPQGPWTATDQTVTLPSDGSATSVEFEVKKKEGKEGEAVDASAHVAGQVTYYVDGELVTADANDFEWDWGGSFESIDFNSNFTNVTVGTGGGGEK